MAQQPIWPGSASFNSSVINLSSKPNEKVLRFFFSSDIIFVIIDESRPPDKEHEMGTSEIVHFFIAF